VPIRVRVATVEDLPAIDGLQKLHHKQLGFFPRAQMEGYLKNEWVIMAEDPAGRLVGYCASRDRYHKRDELGAIFQLCVDPTAQRMFVGANLLRAVFDRAPYGCKLFCCWCAQDLSANHFWEAMGFMPLAFRAGGRGRGQRSEVRGQNGTRGDSNDSSFIPHPSSFAARVHIFWQKRIREGDVTTPWWFPCQTNSGSIRGDRLVLPIPPGLRWSDEMPRIMPRSAGILPGSEQEHGQEIGGAKPKSMQNAKTRSKTVTGAPRRQALRGWSFVPPEPIAAAPAQRAPVVRDKLDPKLIAAARELRDRWLERMNSGQDVPQAVGKYSLARLLGAEHSSKGLRARLIEAQAA
jgi:N-acetylglutamate synthase-like GNAT family acetyltransferase